MILSLPGTPFYIPPEYVKTGFYDGCQATVWQLGVILVEMLPKVADDLSPGIISYGWFYACIQKLQHQFLDIKGMTVF